MNGASAQTGDRVRNLTTGQIGTVYGATQFGRLLVNVSAFPHRDHTAKWERYNSTIIKKGPRHGA